MSHERDASGGRGLVILCLLAVAAGIAVGLVGGAFRWCLERAAELRVAMLGFAETLGGLGWLVPVVVTAVAAALAAVIVRWVPLAAGSGIQHVEAVQRSEASPPPLRVLPARFVGGLLAIGSGLVLGREGPTVHIGAVLGAEAGRRAGRSDADVRVLQTSLAGAGLAVAFGAPLGGAIFVIEEVAASLRMRVVLPTLLGVGVAVGCSRLIIGDLPDFRVGEVAAPTLALLPIFAVVGLLTGLLGVLYSRLVVGFLDLSARLHRVPPIVRAAVIGGIIGLAMVVEPLSVGDGDGLTQLILGDGSIALPALLLLLASRMLSGPLSSASGAPGGLFAPLLAVGAVWGLLCATVVEAVLPGQDLGVPMALVGMAALFAAVVRAPITGVVLVIEMTAVTAVGAPMLVAAGGAALVAMLLRSAPVYDTLRERMLASGTTSGAGAGLP